MVTLSDTPQAAEAEVVDSSASRSYYSISQAAELLGVSRVSIWRWVRAGRLSVVRLGHRTARIKREDLERLPVHIGPSGYRSRTVHQMAIGAPTPTQRCPPGPSTLSSSTSRTSSCWRPSANSSAPPSAQGTPASWSPRVAHLARLEDALTAQGFDLAAARAAGQYVSLDAAETLSRFMVDAEPDPSRFEDVIGALVEGAAAGQRSVRVYGEMVALLAAAGNHRATIRLEQLWNDLQHRAPVLAVLRVPDGSVRR